jgi:hypothetical protein
VRFVFAKETTMRITAAAWFLTTAAALCLGSCQGAGDDFDDDVDADVGDDTSSDTVADAGDDTDEPSGFTSLQGTVYAPSGGFPISGALVYITNGNANSIEDNAYCYRCDDMTDKKWVLSAADGSWSIHGVPVGTYNLVTRKGFFQRQRQITVTGDAVQDVPVEVTTLPKANSDGGLDRIPNYAVLLNGFDLAEDLLAKMGLGLLDGSSHLQQGTEEFDLYNDAYSSASAVGASSFLFASQETLDHYHMVFFPCICDTLTASNYVPMLQSYVAGGGKIYASCWASQWAEQPFPNVIEFYGDDTATNAGNIGYWESAGTIDNLDMRDWLSVVSPTSDLDDFPFYGGYILIDSLATSAYDGHGSDTDGDGIFTGPVIPKTWATDVSVHVGSPLTVTYNYDCGKVFYSTYQVVESESSSTIRPQEWVLIYLFFEVGVCEGDYIPPV